MRAKEIEAIAADLAQHRAHLWLDQDGASSYVAGVRDVIAEMRGCGYVEVELERRGEPRFGVRA